MESASKDDNDADSVDTITSSDDDGISDRDDDESDDGTCETESYRSLAFSVQSDRSTTTVKSKKSKKRVQFKPGDSLVLVYIIPNREMLGLKSESEDSDDDNSDGDDSDDEEEDDSDEESEEDDEDEEDEEEEENKPKVKKPKPFARLMAVRQVTRHKKTDKKNNAKAVREKNSKLINLNINHLTQKPPRRNNRANRRRERKERAKSSKKDSNESKSKQGKSKRNTSKINVINVDIDKNRKSSRKTKPGILEIKATVQGEGKHDTTASVPKLMYKNDLKPSVVNVNGALTVCQTKLLQRSKLQPMSLRVSKFDNRPSSCSGVRPDRQTNVRQVMSTGYDSLTSLLPDSYSHNGFRHSLSTETLKNLDYEGHSPKDYIKRLDPGNMTDSSKRHYAWQVANGTITSQSLRTPSILPFWDSLKPSVAESNTVKLPL